LPDDRNLLILHSRPRQQASGAIAAYARLMSEAVCNTDGWTSRIAEFHPTGTVGRCVDSEDYVLLQYNPYMYGRHGVAPWLVREVQAVRACVGSDRLALMVHEPYVPFNSARFAVLHGPQRAQLALIARACGVRFAATTAWAEKVRRPAFVLPVGSNIPDRRAQRPAERARLGLADDDIVIAAFGTGHPARMTDWIAPAADAIAAGTSQRCVFLNLGDGAPRIASSVPTMTPGRLEPDALAAMISASDLLLAPFVDGVSTRRGSVMAALQHAVPVVTTIGASTGPELLEHRGAWVGGTVRHGQSEFVATAVRVALDAEAGRRIGSTGRDLYARSFDWPVTARALTRRLAP
jgi:hypothetical protein